MNHKILDRYPRLSLARLPTPIHKLEKTSETLGKEIYIWRDDLTGFIESGNKIRKLEFLLADALAKNCDHILTCGGPQSNHTRATAALARRLGLGVSILASLPAAGLDLSRPATGNLLLNQIFGAQMSFIPSEDYQKNGASYEPFLAIEAEKLKKEGHRPYVIPLGGSNALGCLGYLGAVGEMLETWKKLDLGTETPSDLFCVLGSGGTYAGLQLGLAYHSLWSTRLFGINIIDKKMSEKYLDQLHEETSKEFGIECNPKQSEIIDGYVGGGYAVASDDDLGSYLRFAREEGILLDPCYTGKAFRGMISEIQKNPSRFGNQILFLHSGGVFADFNYAEQFHRVMRDEIK